MNENGSPKIGGTIGHTMTGASSILVGRNTATYRIWDGMRGIDYLVSRSDIDPKRIGCTGNSGGGTLTSYIMALDERVVCAVPSCYITTLRHQAPQDAEQNIHGQIAFGMDHADYIMMRAPKPTLLSTATRDFFDIHGAWYAFRQAKRFYTRLGFAERVDLIETDAEHGFSIQLREGMTRWMLRWLRGIDAPITEEDFPILTDEEIQVTPQGQVMLRDGAKTVYDFNLQLEEEYAKARQRYWQEAGREAALQKVRELIGVEPAGDMAALQDVVPMGEIERDGYSIVKLMLTPQDGIVLPALLCGDKSRKAAETILYVDGAGKEAAAAPGGLIDQWLKEGKNVFAVDLRGLGETAKPRNDSEWHRYFGADWPDYFSAYMLNKTYVGMRVQDILNCALYLKRLRIGGEFQQVHLVAIGEAGVPALHAAALEPQIFDSVVIQNSLISWSNVIHNTITKNQLINTVHGALRYYDLPDLAASIPGGKLTIENPVDAWGEPVSE
ncbi:MAG: prolyl oligopeptidase family serine peptidase [Candidatus Hinthialibacter sp.]